MSDSDQPQPAVTSAADRPRLRPLEAYPITERGQRMLALRDPSGLAEAIARLPPPAVAVIQLCDGEMTREEICAEFAKRYGRPLDRRTLDTLLEQLDDALLLDSERFRQHSARVFSEFQRSPTRPAHLAGKSYPADAAALAAMLDGFFEPPNGPGRPTAKDGHLPRAIISPHIDFQRGGAAYAWAYRPLLETDEVPELVVVLGTDHVSGERPFTFTKKHFETPLGRLETDIALLNALEAAVTERLGVAVARGMYYDEHHHRGEHSLEFQMVWLRHVWKERADNIKVLPVLTSTLRHLLDDKRDPTTDAETTVILGELGRLVSDKKVLFIAGADLAHVGPRYGDPDPLTASDRESLERRDQQTFAAVLRAEASAWFAEIAAEGDRRNVCGLSPIYCMLALAAAPAAGRGPIKGRLLAYGQCPADDNGTSIVSIAAARFDAVDPSAPAN